MPSEINTQKLQQKEKFDSFTFHIVFVFYLYLGLSISAKYTCRGFDFKNNRGSKIGLYKYPITYL